MVGVTDVSALDVIGADTKDQYLNRIQSDINTALQKLYAVMPDHVLQRNDFKVIYPPTTLTLTGLGAYNKSFVSSTPFSGWMNGCTIRIDGDPNDNRIIDATTLEAPYMGTSGTRTATVFCDCILPTSNIASVDAPVRLGSQPYPDLVPVVARANLMDSWFIPVWNTGGLTACITRPIRRPQLYFVEAMTSNNVIKPRILLDTLPEAAYRLDFNTHLAAPRFEVSDLTSTTPIDLPLGYGESILEPLVRAEFSSFEAFNGDSKAYMKAAEVALQTVGSVAKFQTHVSNYTRVNPHE